MKKEKGFSLIELIATIFILSIVIGIATYYITNIIDSSTEEEESLAIANVKQTAKLYIEEFPNDIIWKSTNESTNEKYSCISIATLVNKGYLKKEELENLSLTQYVIASKNESRTIIEEKLDDGTICQELNKVINIPTSKEFCSNPYYNGEQQNLIDNSKEHKSIIFNNTTGINAGDYTVKANLVQDNLIWEDGSIDEKEITCSIKKAIPQLILDSNGTDGTYIGTQSIHLTSNINGTITIKSSNKDHATASINNNTILKNEEKEIKITTLASRNTTTYITITVTPTGTDANNYFSSSITYTIGKIHAKEAIPPNNSYCNNLTYSGYQQQLTKTAETGYQFYNNYQQNAGTYTITAKLKYGYIWKDKTNEEATKDITFECSIQKATPKINLSPKTDEVIKTQTISTSITPEIDGNILVTSSSPNDVQVLNPTTTTKITNNQTLPIELKGINTTTSTIPIQIKFTPTDSNNYNETTETYNLKVLTNQMTLTYDANGGNSCNPTSKTVTYQERYGTLCEPTKTGYSFDGWYTEVNGGTKITSDSIVNTINNHTIYAHWKINSYVLDLNLNVDGTAYGSGYNSRVYVGLKVGGTDKGYVEDYYVSNNYGTSWEIYGLKLDGESISYNKSGTVGANNTEILVNLNTISIGVNNTNYGSVSKTSLLAVTGTTYSTNSTTLTLSDKRTVTTSIKNATGYATSFSSWSSTSGTINSKTSITASFSRRTYKVTIYYKSAGGTLTTSSKNQGFSIDSNEYILRNSSKYTTTIDYGKSLGSGGLPNANNSNFIELTKTNRKLYGESAWITTDNKKIYSQTKDYSASDFCNVSAGDCTVTLKVNWGFRQITINGRWHIYRNPGYFYGTGMAKVYKMSGSTISCYDKDTTNYNNIYNNYTVGSMRNKTDSQYITVFGYMTSSATPINNSNYYVPYKASGCGVSKDTAYIKIYIPATPTTTNSDAIGLNNYGYSITKITDTISYNGTTYYGVWIQTSCSSSVCPDDEISLIG